jgi:hypothetical protein
MDKIYLNNNYIVVEVGGETSVFPKFYAAYYETSTHFFISNVIGQSYVRTVSIELADIPNFYDEAGVTAYNINTLRAFLRLNTGFKSPSGGSGGVSDGNKGDITVSGGGAVWDINALAVDDGKISDVDATKVTTNPTKRFVTDANLTVLSNTSGTNSGDETTSSIKTKLGAATGLLDGYLTASDWDIFNGKQPVLISGTNIKTINSASILGSGNLTVSGGSPSLGIVNGTDVTGTTAMTKSASILIPANTITVNTILEIEARAIRVAVATGTIQFQVYFNTSDTLTGATLLGVFLTLSHSNWFSQGRRSLYINPSINTLVTINAGATVADDFVNTGANTSITFDETINNYLIFAVQPSSTASTSAVQYAFAKKYE